MATLQTVLHKESKSTAIIIPTEPPVSLSHEQLFQKSSAFQEKLAAIGIAPGDAVAFALSNSLELVVSFLAVTFQGAICAPLNPEYKQVEFEFYFEDLKPSIVLVPKGALKANGEAIRAASGHCAIAEIFWNGEEVVLDILDSNGLHKRKATEIATANTEHISLILHTSGTTARPKAVPLTHRNICKTVYNIQQTYNLNKEDRTLLVMPLFHVHGLLAGLLAPLGSGGSVIVPKGFSASAFWKDFLTYKANWYTAVPTIHQILLKSPLPNPLPVIRFIRSCSSPLAPTVFQELENRMEAPVLEAYAMTEAAHQITSNPLPPTPRKAGSVGRAQGLDLSITDNDGIELAAGLIGEVCVSGSNVTLGYLTKDPKIIASTFTKKGYLRTGDRGYIDNEGYLFLTGRIKELINKGGEKISPVEIDNTFAQHPSVLEAVSFAIPDEKYGEEIGVAIALNNGSVVSTAELIDWFGRRMVKFKVPKKVYLTAEIPKTATGKVQRGNVAKIMMESEKKAVYEPKHLMLTPEPSTAPVKKIVLPNGAASIAKALQQLDVKVIFGLVGIPVVQIAEEAIALGIRFIAFRNEQAASYAATAYGFLSGRPGVCLVVGGPGVLHAIAGIGNATANAWPMMLLAGSNETHQTGKGAFQELDAVSLLTPLTKTATRVAPDAISSPIHKAYRSAFYGRAGCSLVDLPADVIQGKSGKVNVEKVPPPPRIGPDPARTVEVAKLIKTAEAPLIIVGKGAAYSRAEFNIGKLVEQTDIPFLPTPMGKGILADSHPLNVASARSTALRNADVVLILGARLNWILHFGEGEKWNPSSRLIQVDACSEEIGKNGGDPDLSIIGDVGLTTSELSVALKDWKYPPNTGFRHSLKVSADKNEIKAAQTAKIDRIPMTYHRVFNIIKQTFAKLSPPSNNNIVYISEGANTMDISRSVFTVEQPRLRLDAGTNATMGVGLGYAIAAHAYYNDPGHISICPTASTTAPLQKKVVCIEGDSAFGFSMPEVETMARCGMDVLVFVINNGGIYHGDARSSEDWNVLRENGKLRSTSLGYEVGYEKMAEMCGGKGYVVRTPEELEKATEEGWRADVPVVVNVIVEAGEGKKLEFAWQSSLQRVQEPHH